MLPTIKEIVKDNIVEFSHFASDELHYDVQIKSETKIGVLNTYTFPIPISETKGATFLSQDKAIYFMRFINIALKNGTFRKI